MKASIETPVYQVYAIDGDRKYDIKPAITGIGISRGEKDLAVRVNITLSNVMVDDVKKKLSSILTVKNNILIYVYYDVGSGNQEKFRGIVWSKKHADDDAKEVTIVCYDHLIYLQNSKDSFYFSKGKKTKDVISSICKKWGIKLVYSYSSITHPKLALRSQNISDTIIELLEEVKKKTGKKYVIYSEKNVMYIAPSGSNTTIYTLKNKGNAISAEYTETREGMVTKVVITGRKGNDEKEPVIATVKGNTTDYGTLQDMISKDKDTKLSEAKQEANEILKEKGKPFTTRTVKAVDNPCVKKGDKVKIQTEPINSTYIVKSIEHEPMTRTMTVEVE